MTPPSSRARQQEQNPAAAEHDLEALLEYLKRNRGFDFTGYKRQSLARRIEKRMQSVDVRSYAEYVDFLEVHPEEYAALFNTILINVTRFFRDDTAWEALAKEALPPLIARKEPHAQIRAWTAGCASGEEAYTLAIVLSELLGAEAFRERVKIYATDVDEEALARARQAVYSEREVEGIPEPLLRKYFDRVDFSYCVRKDFRRQVIFGRHDLIQDAPISRVDVLVCRNVLMYFNAETQARILARFHFALNDHGVLFLGRAETLLTHASTFVPLDLKRRISVKVPRANLNLRDRLLLMTQNGTEDAANVLSRHLRLRDFAVDASPVAQVVVDADGAVVLANERARSAFGVLPDDVGRPLQDIRLSYRPVELRSLLEQVYAERRPVLVRDIEYSTSSNATRWFELQVTPLVENGGTLLGASLSYIDVTGARHLHQELERANQELEAAYEELQSTNEELETTKEELQSTIEELETTNEELQSTNEELETMNEELQSTNEELTAMNDELRVRSDELNQVNGFLESILTSLRGGVIVVDKEMRILVWNARAHDLWGLREQEVAGKHLLGLDIGLPVERLRQPMKAALSGSRQSSVDLVVDATNRRGKAIRCRVAINQLVTPSGEVRGLILVMNEADRE